MQEVTDKQYQPIKTRYSVRNGHRQSERDRESRCMKGKETRLKRMTESTSL